MHLLYIGYPIYYTGAYLNISVVQYINMKKSDEYCCDMRGMLSFLILFLLSKRPMHGQEIADELGKRRGIKPSPGTIYPALKGLKDTKLINEKKSGKIIVYNLTRNGKRVLDVAKKRFCRTFMGLFPS